MSVVGVSTNAARGEIWWVDLDPTVGREQAGRRPALVVSVDAFNASPRGLVTIPPLSGTIRGLPTHVEVHPPEGGLARPSAIMVEQVRTISKHRLAGRLGSVDARTLGSVEAILRMVLGL
jgi:mRNA interferase MazF